MDYHEYLCKVDNIKTFVKKRCEIEEYIDIKCSERIAYHLLEFKEEYNNKEKGLYVYVYGDRNYGNKFIKFLKNNPVGISISPETIDEANNLTPFSSTDILFNGKFSKLLEEKSNSFGRVIYEKPPNSKKRLIEELESEKYIKALLDDYDIPVNLVVKKYMQNERDESICEYVVNKIEDYLKSENDLVERIDSYEKKKGKMVLKNINYFTDSLDTGDMIDYNIYSNIPYKWETIKDNTSERNNQAERQL